MNREDLIVPCKVIGWLWLAVEVFDIVKNIVKGKTNKKDK